MLSWNKMKKLCFVALLCSLFPLPAQACNPLNPICLFKMLLKATPGFPVMDFVSIPGIIPHVPATLQKEGQAQLKKLADKKMQELRGGVPSASGIGGGSSDKSVYPELDTPAEGEPYPSLAGFPDIDTTDPEAVAKSIEVLFVRPSYENSKELSVHDRALMKYQAGMFRYNNAIEIAGFLAEFKNKFRSISAGGTSKDEAQIKENMSEAEAVEQALAANYEAAQMEYQLNLLYNELLAAQLQLNMADKLANEGIILDKPVLGAM